MQPALVDVELLIQSFDPERTNRRVLRLAGGETLLSIDLDGQWRVPRRDWPAINMPARLDLNLDVQSSLLPSNVIIGIRVGPDLYVRGTQLLLVARPCQGRTVGHGLQQLAGALACAVVLLDSLLGYGPRLVEDKNGRVRDPLLMRTGLDSEGCVVGLQLSVQQTQFGDDAAAHIGQKREVDPLGRGKVPQHLLRVIADSDQRDAGADQLAVYLLQLNELRLAVGSPLGASIEHNQGTTACPPSVEGNRLTASIGELDLRKGGANGGPDLGQVSAVHLHVNLDPGVHVPGAGAG